VTILAVLASGSNSTSDIGDVEPGLLGFLVVAALGLALVFLLRSMNKQFRKIGPKPEDVEAEAADEAGDGDGDGDEVAAGEAGPAQVTADGAAGTGWASSSEPASGKTRPPRPWED
jgi:hypothetical protein